jgi:hypothetical protein
MASDHLLLEPNKLKLITEVMGYHLDKHTVHNRLQIRMPGALGGSSGQRNPYLQEHESPWTVL